MNNIWPIWSVAEITRSWQHTIRLWDLRKQLKECFQEKVKSEDWKDWYGKSKQELYKKKVENGKREAWPNNINSVNIKASCDDFRSNYAHNYKMETKKECKTNGKRQCQPTDMTPSYCKQRTSVQYREIILSKNNKVFFINNREQSQWSHITVNEIYR